MIYSFPNLELVCFSMSSSNCCFLTFIQIAQEAGKVACYSHLLKNFPQFVVVHTVKGFGIVKEAKVDVSLKLSRFFNSTDVGNLISGSSIFSKCSLNIWRFSIHILLKPGLENFETVRSSMSGSNCCFLTCIQVSQKTSKVVWYSHNFKNFP